MVGKGTIELQLISSIFIMLVTNIGSPLGVREQTCNIFEIIGWEWVCVSL